MSPLLALAILLQETPAEAFQKIESAIENARTFRVEFSVDAASEDAVASKGSFTLDQGNRVKLSIDLRSKKRPAGASLTVDGDGTRIVSTLERDTVEVPFDPKTARSNLSMYLSRLGIFSGSFFQHGFWKGSQGRRQEAMTIDLKQMFQVANIRSGGEGKGGTRILTYDLKTAFQPTPLEGAKIWYDPKTYKIVRREYELTEKAGSIRIIEDYTLVQLGDESAAGTETKAKPPPPPPIPDSELDTLFFKAKLQVAESHLKSGKKDKAVEVLEDAIKTYPKHSLVAEAQRILAAARK